MKIVFIGIGILGILGAAYYFGFSSPNQKSTTQQEPVSSASPTSSVVDYRSGFKIYTNGTMRIFSDPRYHNQSPDAYLEAVDPSIVHVKKRGVTWGNFFDTLPSPMKVRKDCLTTGTSQLFCSGPDGTLRFFLNGVETRDLLGKEIVHGDRVLVTFGNNEEVIQQQLATVPEIE